ncbi:PQQ-binding-like beta-propeller repeat protein [Actinoplanes sp. CA-030573]|uniref:outer membrane protein assembly factor BamB family protein n=1 Tax=Actinoplanes sp. CA-030573 TaxID=3239898 RepID=UPI003D8F9E8D
MEDTAGMVVIDLGLERGEPPTYDSPGRPTVPLWFPAAILAVVVLMLTAGSVAPARSPLATIFRLQVGPADTYALSGDGQLLAQTFGLLTSYDLTSGQMRWQAGQSTPAYRLRLSEDLVLMRPWTTGATEPGTTAVSVFTGASQWERPGNVITVAGSSRLLAVSSVRSLTGTGRRVQGPIEAVDSTTGRTLWTVPVPSTAVLLGVPGVADESSRMLLVHDNRTFAVHDLDTGKLLATAKVPAADYNPDNPVVADGKILLRHPGEAGAEISAYDPVTLKQLWTEPAGSSYQMQACGVLACLSGAGGVRAIDPATGDTLWTRRGWQEIEQFGTLFVAYGGTDGTIPLGVVDVETGALRLSLRGWRPVTGGGEDGNLLLVRAADTRGRTMVAVARPGDARPRVLGALPAGTGDCQAAPSRLVCRTMYGELVVWSYQESYQEG